MTITMDNASSNDAAVEILKSKLPNLLDKGKYLHVRCVAHIINLIVQDGLKVQNQTIECIRNAVRHIRASPSRLDTFKTCVSSLKVATKGLLSLDVSTRWNSTYDMLERAIELEKAIDLYGRKESSFRNEVPSRLDWLFAKKMTEILELFKRKTVDLSCSNYVIAHEVYAEVMDIGENLNQMFDAKGQHFEFLNMISRMKQKFEKYYEDHGDKSNKLFEFAAILDPRVKLVIIEYSCAKSCELMRKSGLLKTNEEFQETFKEMVEGVKSEMKRQLREYEDLESASSSIPVSQRDKTEEGRGKKSWMGKLEQFRGADGQSSGYGSGPGRFLKVLTRCSPLLLVARQ
ncbi:putative ribonuclease H-like superfamily, hAT-like transposase, RNase-H [Helianthus annuus]|nr:putative ribonuclease H-like superfamily, hAT-like transposase, RNase-H [Helianthus annuus]